MSRSESETCECSCDSYDVLVCAGVVLMSFGVAIVGIAYLFPYDHLNAQAANPLYGSARETESAELRAWMMFTVPWTAGLILIALGVIVVTSTVVYFNCLCQHSPVTSSNGDVIPLTAHTRPSYGSSDSELTRGHLH